MDKKITKLTKIKKTDHKTDQKTDQKTDKNFIAADIFDPNDLSKFAKYIVRVLPYKGISMSRFYLCDYASVQFLTKLSLYVKPAFVDTNDIKLQQMPTNAEIEIIKVLNAEITNKNKSPGIIELIYTKTIDNISNLTTEEKCNKYLYSVSRDPYDDLSSFICSYVDMIKENIAFDKLSFLVLDQCNITLGEYLYHFTDSPINRSIFKSLLFQVVQTIYSISKVFPKFLHNDLHTSNVMLKFDTNYKFNATMPKFLVYIINDTKYAIPYFGIIVKVIDYGFSAIPELNIKSNINNDKLTMYDRSENDLLYLYHWIHIICNQKTDYIIDIIRQLEPNQTYIRFLTTHIRKLEAQHKIPSYTDMITNALWDEYINNNLKPEYILTEFS